MLDFARDANHQAFWAAGTVLDALYDYQIPKQNVVGAVGDNTASMVHTLVQISEYHTSAFPHGCFAHLLQRAILTAVEGTPSVYDIIKECSSLVRFTVAARNFCRY